MIFSFEIILFKEGSKILLNFIFNNTGELIDVFGVVKVLDVDVNVDEEVLVDVDILVDVIVFAEVLFDVDAEVLMLM
jgi:hypothetical protein